MSQFLNPIAEYIEPDSGVIVSPEQADVLERNSFFCPDHDCRDPGRNLILKHSKYGNPFFSHIGNYGHDIRPETLLHKLAIRWFVDKTEYDLPADDSKSSRFPQQTVAIDPLLTKPEYRFLQLIVPDVKLCTVSGFEFAIEIVVSNDISAAKAKKIEAFYLPTLRVDLSAFYQADPDRCKTNFAYVAANLDELLKDIRLKQWVIAPDLERNRGKVVITANAGKHYWLPWVFAGVTIFTFSFKWIKKVFWHPSRRPSRFSKKTRKRRRFPLGAFTGTYKPRAKFPRKNIS